MTVLLLFIFSFLSGSIPTGMLVARSSGIDLRKVGSGNIGATNVMRAAGKKAALITLLGDIAKGAVPVWAASVLCSTGYIVPPSELDMLNPLFSSDLQGIEQLTGLAAILGHDFSLFLKFRGGKGVATSLGAVLAYSPAVGLFTIMIWLMTARFTRYSSLSALTAFGFLPLTFFMLDYSPEKLAFGAVVALLIFFKHAENIKRLINGTESRIGQK